jgi:hypothetical protein
MKALQYDEDNTSLKLSFDHHHQGLLLPGVMQALLNTRS